MSSEWRQVGVVLPTLYSITPDADWGTEENLVKNGKPPLPPKPTNINVLRKFSIDRSETMMTVSEINSKRKTDPLINNLRDALASKGMLYENDDDEDDTDEDEKENLLLFSEDDSESESKPAFEVSPELELGNTKTPEIVNIKRPIPRPRTTRSLLNIKQDENECSVPFEKQVNNDNPSTEEIPISSDLDDDVNAAETFVQYKPSSLNFGRIAWILVLSIYLIICLYKVMYAIVIKHLISIISPIMVTFLVSMSRDESEFGVLDNDQNGDIFVMVGGTMGTSGALFHQRSNQFINLSAYPWPCLENL